MFVTLSFRANNFSDVAGENTVLTTYLGTDILIFWYTEHVIFPSGIIMILLWSYFIVTLQIGIIIVLKKFIFKSLRIFSDP